MYTYIYRWLNKDKRNHVEQAGVVRHDHFTLTEKHNLLVIVRETKKIFLLRCTAIICVGFFGIFLPLEISG